MVKKEFIWTEERETKRAGREARQKNSPRMRSVERGTHRKKNAAAYANFLLGAASPARSSSLYSAAKKEDREHSARRRQVGVGGMHAPQWHGEAMTRNNAKRHVLAPL